MQTPASQAQSASSNPHAGCIVVTGASGGIGAAVARQLARAGHAICAHYGGNRDAAEALVAALRQEGARAIACPAEISDAAAVEALFERASRELGPLRGLVNNAGITGPAGRLEQLEPAALRQVLEVNVVGSFLCSQAAVRRMSTRHGGQGGAIVNVSSRAAVLGGADNWIHYAASKGAVDSMTVGLAIEVAREGIRVNAVRPGIIATDIHAKAGLGDRLERMAGVIPLGRVGTPGEVAETVVWLLSDAARYVTGAVVDVGGGR